MTALPPADLPEDGRFGPYRLVDRVAPRVLDQLRQRRPALGRNGVIAREERTYAETLLQKPKTVDKKIELF